MLGRSAFEKNSATRTKEARHTVNEENKQSIIPVFWAFLHVSGGEHRFGKSRESGSWSVAHVEFAFFLEFLSLPKCGSELRWMYGRKITVQQDSPYATLMRPCHTTVNYSDYHMRHRIPFSTALFYAFFGGLIQLKFGGQ